MDGQAAHVVEDEPVAAEEPGEGGGREVAQVLVIDVSNSFRSIRSRT